MKTKLYSRDILLILAASFCYFSSPMLVTPLITGFAGSVGASAALMGVIGGLMNLCSLFCRPLVGNLADRLSKYKVSTAGAALMSLACLGYILSSHPAGIVFSGSSTAWALPAALCACPPGCPTCCRRRRWGPAWGCTA